MNRFQEAVQEFHEATGGFGNVNTPEGRLLRAKLIMEEAVETAAALGFEVKAEIADPLQPQWGQDGPDGDIKANFSRYYDEFNLLDFIDGLCDLTYVTMGGAVNVPVNLERHFEEVHRANMDKTKGKSFRDDGKVLKPEGWVPPDHQRVLALYGLIGVPGPFVDTYHGSEAEQRHERLTWQPHG